MNAGAYGGQIRGGLKPLPLMRKGFVKLTNSSTNSVGRESIFQKKAIILKPL